MTPCEYIQYILDREKVETLVDPLYSYKPTESKIKQIIRNWAGQHLISLDIGGSLAKETANNSSTDIDLFISLNNTFDNTLGYTYQTLFDEMKRHGYRPEKQNVAIKITINDYKVDLVIGVKRNHWSDDHSLYKNRNSSWIKTNISKQIKHVKNSGCTSEIRFLKLWRDQKGLDFPSFYLELCVIEALRNNYNFIDERILACFEYLRDRLATARIIDPANVNNTISDDLDGNEKTKIIDAAKLARNATIWEDIVR